MTKNPCLTVLKGQQKPCLSAVLLKGTTNPTPVAVFFLRRAASSCLEPECFAAPQPTVKSYNYTWVPDQNATVG
jgi:hypothetical protein